MNQDGSFDLSTQSDETLLALWASLMAELRSRGVVRSSNNPVGDFAEKVVAERLGLTLQTNSTAGYDAVDNEGLRYQIKARRLNEKRGSRQLSAIRNLDQGHFDFLIVAFFDVSFSLTELWNLPFDLVRDYARYHSHVNGHRLIARGAVLEDPRAIRLPIDEVKGPAQAAS